MFKKLLKQLKSDNSKPVEDEIQQVLDDIDAKQKEIAIKRTKIQEEFSDGSRLTKHRFTL